MRSVSSLNWSWARCASWISLRSCCSIDNSARCPAMKLPLLTSLSLQWPLVYYAKEEKSLFDVLQHPPPQQHLPTPHNRLFASPTSASNHLYHLAQCFLALWKTQAQHKLLACTQSEFTLPERGMYQVCLLANKLHQSRNLLSNIAIVDRTFTERKRHFLAPSIIDKISS